MNNEPGPFGDPRFAPVANLLARYRSSAHRMRWTRIPELMRLPSITFLVLAVVLPGCDGDTPPGVTVTDSAGVQITLNPDIGTNFAEVDPEPLLSLGGPDASGPTQFFQVQHVHVDPEGRLWVADGRSSEIRIFQADGSHWKTIGGRGEGPGEFVRLRMLGAFRGDSVAVWDTGNGRLTVFSPEGELVRTQRSPAGGDPSPRASGVFDDGSLLAQVPRVLAAAALEAGQILGDTARLVRVDVEAGTQRPIGTAPGPLWLWTGRSQIPIPFTANASLAVLQESVHLVAGPAFRVRVFEDGRLTEMYGVSREPNAVSEADLAEYRVMTDEYIPEARRDDYWLALNHRARPTILPAYYRLLVAADENLWAQVYSSDFSGPWDVFDRDRRLLGRVETPEGFMPMTILGESWAGVWRDELGVEHVRVYQIRLN